MPIQGLSEQRRLPRLGKIRLGIKKKSEKTGNEYPSATDYFVVPDELKKILGETPRELPIMIPVEDDEIWCNQYYKCYSFTRGLTCKGDGVTCRRMVDTATGEKANKETIEVVWQEGMPCIGRECPYYKANECKETMNLQFLMPDVPGLGIWQVDTGSINSIRNINNAAAMIRAVYKRISFIPLLLTIEPQEVVNPDDGKKKTVHVLNLRTRGTMRELLEISSKQAQEWLLISAPADDEAPDDETDLPSSSVKMIKSLNEGDKDWDAMKSASEFKTEPEHSIPVTATVVDSKQAKPEPPKKESKPKQEKPHREPRDPATVQSTTELLKFCFDDFSMQPKAVLDELNIKSLMELTVTPAEAYMQIQSVRK